MLHRHPGHAEPVARVAWCVEEAAIGVVTGEVGAGKTVAVRAALGGRAYKTRQTSAECDMHNQDSLERQEDLSW